jgi:hypothetical protein
MKANMGSADRAVRIIAALLILVLYLANQITGTAAIILGIIAAIFVLTGFTAFCPLYAPFKISTKKEQKA